MIQLFQKNRPELTGSWEEPGVIGTRIEIEKNRVLILWRNGPVLDTTFTVEKTPEGVLRLRLKENGLRYESADSDYASVTDLYWKDGALHYCQLFPISGPSEEILKKTENSRFGNYTDVSRKILPELQGRWKDTTGYHELRFRGSILENGTEKIRVCVLHSNYLKEDDPVYRVVDADPAKYSVFFFGSMDYRNGELTAVIPVCDAPSIDLTFHKEQEK